MNHLNSVLIEGVISDPRTIIIAPEGEDWGEMVGFNLENHKEFRSKDGSRKCDVTVISCVMFGKLADKVLQSLKKGMTVRVLGKLRSRKNDVDGTKDIGNGYDILVEHLEYRRKNGKGSEEVSISK